MSTNAWKVLGWLFAFASAGAFLYVVAETTFASQESAAWAQAIGTVGAIVAAVWIGQRQIEVQQEREQRQRAAFKLALRDAIESPQHFLGLVQKALVTRDAELARHAVAMIRELEVAAPIAKLVDDRLDIWPTTRIFQRAARFRRALNTISAFRPDMLGPKQAEWSELANALAMAEGSRRYIELHLQGANLGSG